MTNLIKNICFVIILCEYSFFAHTGNSIIWKDLKTNEINKSHVDFVNSPDGIQIAFEILGFYSEKVYFENHQYQKKSLPGFLFIHEIGKPLLPEMIK